MRGDILKECPPAMRPALRPAMSILAAAASGFALAAQAPAQNGAPIPD